MSRQFGWWCFTSSGSVRVLLLDSPRWSELDTFFGAPEDMPNVLSDWVASIGFDQETANYQKLYQLFLHQVTITNVAYAVVPWIVEHHSRAHLDDQAMYLTDVSTVEYLRLTCGLHSLREGGDSQPDFLMDDYHHAILRAQTMAEDLMDEAALHEDLRNDLWQMVPALFGNAEVAKQRWDRQG